MEDVVKVNWSGGKDSSCAELLHIQEGHHTKVVNYIPMFTKDIPLISKRHYDFIMNIRERFKKMGVEVYAAEGITYWDFVHYCRVKGEKKGIPMGFPCFLTSRCNFKGYSKIKALNSLNVGYYDYQDIGIAVDEVNRYNQLTDIKRSILVEKGVTEQQAYDFCKKYGLLSPHYESQKRDGCSLCPHKSAKDREEWFKDYPDARNILIELQDFVKENLPGQFPLRNHRWFL